MSLFDFNSIINSYNQPVVQGSNTLSDKNKTSSSKDSSSSSDTQKYIEQQRTLAEILAEQGIEATQRNKEIAKVLHAYNQMINKATIDYVKKMMAELKFNNEKAYEAYMVLFTNSLEASQKNLDLVQRIIQDKNVILEIKEFISIVDKLTEIIDTTVDDEIKKLQTQRNETINKVEIESKIIKNLVKDLYISKIIPESVLNDEVGLIRDIVPTKATSENTLDAVKEKTNILKVLDNQSELLLNTKEKASIIKSTETELLVNNLKDNVSINLDKSFKETNNSLINTETKVVYEEVKTVESKNFYKITNKNINDFLSNKMQINKVDFSEKNLNYLGSLNNSNDFSDSSKIEGFEYHLRNTGMSDDIKKILKEPLFAKQEVKDGESIIHIISKESSVPRASFKLTKLPQETILVNNTPVLVNIDGKPRLVLKDKTGVKILLVNLDMVQKMIGFIKPESAKVIIKDGHQFLIFKDDFSNQEKTIPLDNKISVKENLVHPKIISRFGDKNVLALDNNTGDIHIVPLKYILGNSYVDVGYVGVGFKPTPTITDTNDIQSTQQKTFITLDKNLFYKIAEKINNHDSKNLNIVNTSDGKVFLLADNKLINMASIINSPKIFSENTPKLNANKIVFVKNEPQLLLNIESNNVLVPLTESASNFIKNNISDIANINQASLVSFNPSEKTVKIAIGNNSIELPFDSLNYFSDTNVGTSDNHNLQLNTQTTVNKSALATCPLILTIDGVNYVSFTDVEQPFTNETNTAIETPVKDHNNVKTLHCNVFTHWKDTEQSLLFPPTEPAPEVLQSDTKNLSTQDVKALDSSSKVNIPSISNITNVTKVILLPINNIIENLPIIPNLSENMVNLKETPFIDNDNVLFVDQNNNTVSLPLPALVEKISELRNNSMNNFFSTVNDKKPPQIFKINDQSFFVSSINTDGLELVPSLGSNILDKNDPKVILIENNESPKGAPVSINSKLSFGVDTNKNIQTNNPNKEYILLQEKDPLLQPVQIEKLQALNPITTVVINGEGFFIMNKADKNKKTSTITEIKSLNSENFGVKSSETIKPFNYHDKNIVLLNLFGQDPKIADLSIPENHTFLKPFSEPIIDEEGNIIFPNEKKQQIFMLNNSSVKNFKSFAIPEHNIVENQNEKIMLFKSDGKVFVANLENVKPTNLSNFTSNNYFVGKNQNNESVIYKTAENNEIKKIMVDVVPKTFFINLTKPMIFNENGNKVLVFSDKGDLVKIPVEPKGIDLESPVTQVEVGNKPHLLTKVDGKITLVSKENLDKNSLANNIQLSDGNDNVFIIKDNGQIKLVKPTNSEIKELKNNEKIVVKIGAEILEFANEKGVLKPTKTDTKIPSFNLEEPIKVDIDGKPALIFKDEKGAVKLLKTDNLNESEVKEDTNFVLEDSKGKKVLVSNENGMIKKSSLEMAIKQSDKIPAPTNFVKDGESFFIIPDKETGKEVIVKQNLQDTIKPINEKNHTFILNESPKVGPVSIKSKASFGNIKDVLTSQQATRYSDTNKDGKNILFFYDPSEMKYKAVDTHNINKFSNKLEVAEEMLVQNNEPLISLKNENGKNLFFNKNEIQSNSKILDTPLSINHNSKASMIVSMAEGIFNIPVDKAIKLSKNLINPFITKNNDEAVQIIFPKNKENNNSTIFEVSKDNFAEIRDSKDPVIFDDNSKIAYKEDNQVKIFDVDKNFEKSSKEIIKPIKVEHDNKEKILLFKNEKPYFHTMDNENNIKIDKHFHGIMDNKSFTFYPNEKTNMLNFQSFDEVDTLKKDSTNKKIFFDDIKTVELLEPLNYSLLKPNESITGLKNLSVDSSNQNYNDFTKIIREANELKATINNIYDNSLLEDPRKFAEKIAFIQQFFGSAEAQIKAIKKDLEPFKSDSNEDSEGLSDNPITEILGSSKNKSTKSTVEPNKKKGSDMKMSFESLLKAVLSEMSSKIEKISLNLYARELLTNNEKTFAVPLSFSFGDLKLSGEMIVKQEDDNQTKTNLGKTISIKLAVETKNLEVVVLEFTNMEKDLQIAIKVENRKIKEIFDNKIENINSKLKKSKYYVKPVTCSINQSPVKVNSFIIPKNTFPKSLKKIDGLIL